MKAFGNLMNRLAEDTKSVTPEVGMGATRISFSDRHAFTITRVEGKKLWATPDIAKRTDNLGMSDSQSYDYTTDPDALEYLFTLRKDGRWHEGTTLRGSILCIGYRNHYHDYGF